MRNYFSFNKVFSRTEAKQSGLGEQRARTTSISICFNPSWTESSCPVFIFAPPCWGHTPPWKWSLVSRKPPVPNQLATWPVTAHLNHFKRKWYWLHLFKSYSSHFLTSLESKTKTKRTNQKNHTVAENSALKFSVVNHRGKQRGARHNWFACLIKCWYFRKHQIVKLI